MKRLTSRQALALLTLAVLLAACNGTSSISTTTATPTHVSRSTQPASTGTSIPVYDGCPRAVANPKQPNMVGFNFEDGVIKGFGTSEGQYKLAMLCVVRERPHTGMNSLKVTTALLGDGNDAYTSKLEVFRHTEVVVYFDQRTPEGLNPNNAPYDWRGKTVSCWVYLPTNLLALPYYSYIRLFVKDGKFANDFSDPVYLSPQNLGKWTKLSLTIGSGKDHPDGQPTPFNPKHVNAIGIRLETANGSSYKNDAAVFYIDDISITG